MAYASWREWHDKCLLARCGPETQGELREFVCRRFRRAARHCAPYAGVGDAMARQESDRAWHQFESFLALRQTREGKPYKKWIFDRIRYSDDAPLVVVLGGVSLLVRWVVRTQLRDEYPSPRFRSLHAPVHGQEGRRLEALLPVVGSPIDSVAEAECRQLASRAADEFFDTLSEQERLVLWAKQNRVSLAHPGLERRTGVKSSRLNLIYHQTLRKLADWSRQRHSREDDSTQMQLALGTLGALKHRISTWSTVENRPALCFPNKMAGMSAACRRTEWTGDGG